MIPRFAVFLAFLTAPCALRAADRPNLVFILADDLGWSDTTLYGTTTFYETPNIERLAKRGMLLTNAYTAHPLVRGPSIKAGSVCRVPVAGYDFLPTFHELAGGKAVEGKLSEELDGGSFVALFSDPETDAVKRPIDGLIFSRPRQGMAVIRSGQWKLLAEINTKREIQSAKLFNVVDDIAEERDLSTMQADKARQLQARLKTYLENVVDPSPTMKRRKKAD